MSSLSPNDMKAIAWWCKEHNLRPELSAHPEYNFTNKETGEKTKRNISNLRSEYERHREQAKKAKKSKRVAA